MNTINDYKALITECIKIFVKKMSSLRKEDYNAQFLEDLARELIGVSEHYKKRHGILYKGIPMCMYIEIVNSLKELNNLPIVESTDIVADILEDYIKANT